MGLMLFTILFSFTGSQNQALLVSLPSWFSQPPHRSEDAGSYGYRCEWTLSADEARSLPDRFEIVLESSTGFSLYERESGRYAIGTELWVPETQHTLASSV